MASIDPSRLWAICCRATRQRVPPARPGNLHKSASPSRGRSVSIRYSPLLPSHPRRSRRRRAVSTGVAPSDLRSFLLFPSRQSSATTSRQPDRFIPIQTTAGDIDRRSEVGSKKADLNNFIAERRTLISARHLNIFFVLGVALSLRLLVPLLGYLYTRDISIFHGPDTESYVLPAQELITHQRFFSQGAPEVIRTPGYPLLLTMGLLLGHLDLVTILIQVMLSCFTVYMVYRTAQTLFKCERTSMTAAAMYAIEPLSILYTGGLLTETLFAALLMTGVYLLLVYLERRRIQYLLASGVVLAMSTYVRPIAYFLPVIIAAALSIWGLATVHDKN